ncbi:phospholipase D-like domain-containing protein [Acidisoma silvae]|uniref:Phospholipase D n=1 Tax=Acidisoma silvae TaxID=2802396 RepID=A0A963YP78_9PROT|nr:phospholipase D-like domain-containing protein [Acidisoma silvae]MCB8874526.1 phospholipase [Acidisoma silvae]
MAGQGIFDEGRNCWQVARADTLSVIIDAEAYFAILRKALLAATKRVMLVGWDFDARIGFHTDDRVAGEPDRIGEFLLWLVERSPDLEVYLLRWDTGALKSLFQPTTAITAVKWAVHPRIHVKLDGHHPTASSHHQKMVSIDDCLAFCGGIDMTADRWDTRAHIHQDPRRVQPGGKPYKPWHDASTALSGPVAAVISQECRDRWERATAEKLPAIDSADPLWPEGLAPLLHGVDVAVARSHPEMSDQTPVLEIEQLFIDQIAAARRVIYLESQYFASRRIAEAIGQRLQEADGPEIVVINPETAEGWLQPLAMDSARARLIAALRKHDAGGRLAVYHPYTSGGDPIYVHAKITIIDDRMIRIGSANINNRSMRLDTECDVCIDAERNPDAGVAAAAASIRNGLLAEHLGISPQEFSEVYEARGSLIAAIEQLRGPGRSLRPYEIPDLDAVETWLADNEVLDPEGPAELFEPLSKNGLFQWLSPPG